MKTKESFSFSQTMVLAVLAFAIGGKEIAVAQAPWTEAWNSATAGTYSFNVDGEAFVPGDRGTWHIQDVDGAPSGNQVAVENVGGNKRLKLTCINGGGLQASLDPLNIALTSGTRLALTMSGTLINPYWNGAFPTVFPPPGDNVHLMLQDNRGNMLVYLFQRASNYPAHNTTLNYLDGNGQPVTLGYREVFVDSANASGGSYLLNLYNDFSAVIGFVPTGASISFIEFVASGTASGTGVATMDDLQIGNTLTATSPNATVQPQNQTIHYGGNATFLAAAVGTAPFSYQWRKDGSNIVGATQMTLTIPNATLAAQGDYSVRVTNQVGAITSLVATLTVDARPYILTQPVDRTVESGDTVNLSIVAGGAPTLTYQWIKDEIALLGQNGPALNIPSATTSNAGTYTVVVSNSFGITNSDGAVLAVFPPIALGDGADAPQLVWTNGGNLPWKPQRVTTFDGVDALEAGPVMLSQSGPQTAWIETVVPGPGILSFQWRVSGFYFSLFVNHSLQASTTSAAWKEVRLALGKGPQRIRWSFDANAFISSGSYKGWLDQVRVLPRATSGFYENANAIQFPFGGFSGSGNPYPSVINVSGMVSDVTEVVVHLNELTMDTDGGGLDLLLVAPSGEASIVMSDAALLYGVSQATLQIDDLALVVIPRNSTFTNGVFLPSDYPRPNDAFPQDSFPSAPAGPWPHTMAAFRGANPNGQWKLFARYGSPFGGSGQMAGGWSLELLTRRDSMRLESTRLWGPETQFVLTGPPGMGFMVEVTSNLVDWVPVLLNNIPPQGWFPFQDDSNVGSASRFYRTVEVSPGPPTITIQPQSQTAFGGANVSFSVAATSPWPLNYQWQKNNVPIGSATNATLTLTNVNESASGIYSVVVGNLHGNVNSSNANLTVLVPVNDAFANRLPITGMSNRATGLNLNATTEIGEPYHAGFYGGKSVWWTWTAPANGTVTIDTIGSSFDTLLAVYTGTSVSSLSTVASDNDSGGFHTSKLTFVCVAGTTYQIAVDGVSSSTYGESGTVVLNLKAVPPGPPTINTQPLSRTVATGANVIFNVVATSPWSINYQWWKDTTPIGSATGATLTLTNVQSGDAGSYSVVVGNGYADTNSAAAILTVVVVPNDAFADRLVTTGMTNTATGANLGATKEGGEPNHAGYAGGKSVWWTWTAPTNGTVTVDTIGSSFDTLLAVYTGSSVGGLSVVASNNDGGGNGTSKLTFIGVMGTTYQIAVDGYNGASGNIILNLKEVPPLAPEIATQPQSLSVIAGANVNFSVTATGTSPLSFQWRKDTANIGGAISATYNIPSAQPNHAGGYSVVVSNAYGGVTSTVAVLTVNQSLLDTIITGANSYVGSLAIQADGKFLVGGGFTILGSQFRRYIGRLDANGTLDTSFNPGAEVEVDSLAIQADGKILVGGYFTTLGGQSRNFIGRLNADGTLDTNFNPGANGSVGSLAIQADGKILVGGSFTTLGGQARNCIGRLNADGTLDTNFNPVANSAVYSVALQTDGKILLGGYFTTLAGQSRNYIGRLNTNGTLDTSFIPVANGHVDSVTLQADGKILLGGEFTSIGGLNRNYIGRLNADGTLDTSFNPGAGNRVVSLVPQADGKILVGGLFTTLGGQPRNYIGRLDADGTLDPIFNPGANNTVLALAVQSDGKILVAGHFTTLENQARNRVGRFNNTSPATQNLSLNGSTLTWMRGGTSPEVWRTTFEISSDGVNWSSLGAGSRITGGWELTGVVVPANSSVRARGYAVGGFLNGCNWFLESIVQP